MSLLAFRTSVSSSRSDRVATYIKKYIYMRNSKHLFWPIFALEGCLLLQFSITSVLLLSLLFLCLSISVKKWVSPKQSLCYKSQSTFVICCAELLSSNNFRGIKYTYRGKKVTQTRILQLRSQSTSAIFHYNHFATLAWASERWRLQTVYLFLKEYKLYRLPLQD